MTPTTTETAAPKTERKRKAPAKPKATRKANAAPKPKGTRKTKPRKAPKLNKSEVLRGLLRQPEGATLDEIVEATQWQKDTARAWLSRGGGSTQKPGPKVHRDPETGRYRQPVE